jgi:hypothetical protein
MLTEIPKNAPVEQLACRLRKQHLPSVAGTHNPCRLVHLEADVLRLIEPRLGRVDPDPNQDHRLLQTGHRLLDCGHRLTRRGEGVKEPVARGINLVPGMTRAGPPDDLPMLGQCSLVAVATELPQ